MFAAIESIGDVTAGPVILLSPRGRRFTQAIAHDLAGGCRLTLIAGHYEGVDERVSTHLVTDELSIGDYVLSGGELAAMVVVDAVARLLPGAIDEQSTVEESFVSGLLEYPANTRARHPSGGGGGPRRSRFWQPRRNCTLAVQDGDREDPHRSTRSRRCVRDRIMRTP